MVGGMAGQYIALPKVSDYIEKLTIKYQVDEQLAQEANINICSLLKYVVTNEEIDRKYVNELLYGPVLESVLGAIASSPHKEELANLIQEKISKDGLNMVTVLLQIMGNNELIVDLEHFVSSLGNVKDKLENGGLQDDLDRPISLLQIEERAQCAKLELHSNGVGKVRESMTDEEETEFIASLTNNSSNVVLNNPAEVLNAIRDITVATTEVVKFIELQKTKRIEINARKEEAICRIDAMRDAIKFYMEKTFDERSSIFAKHFKCIDAALVKGDINLLSVSLNSINTLATSSPFKNLADLSQVQKQLADSNTIWDI